MSAPLPLLLAAERDETWHSYLTRRAAQHGCTLTELADALGVREEGRWPGYYGVKLDREMRDRLAHRLSLAPEAVDDLQLARYDQRAFDLTGLSGVGGINTTRTVAAKHWTWLAGSTYCPSCLKETGGWSLRWRLPWITACPTHEVALVGHCPACGGVAGLTGRIHASAPQRVHAAPDGRCCARPAGPKTCGADLTTAPTAAAGRDRVTRVSLFMRTVDTGRGTVLGQEHTSLQTLTAWQSAIGAAVRLGVVDADGWGRAHRQINPPRDPNLVDRLLATVEPLVMADNPHIGGDVLESWMQRAGIRSPHRLTFARITRPSAALQPAIDELLRRHGRAHARLHRRLELPDGNPLAGVGYTVDDVPQLAWPCSLPPAWRDSSKPDQRILRAIVAMVLVRAIGGGDWVAAGDALGIPADKARNWTRYAFSSRFGTLRGDLIDSALHAGRALSHSQGLSQWRSRPRIDGYGVTSLTYAQQPPCANDDPRAWCPCRREPTPAKHPSERP